VIDVSHPPELVETIENKPESAIVATSEDSHNLLLVQHLLAEFDLDEIVVRVNHPRNIEAYTDLPVAVVDAAGVTGSALVHQRGRSNSSP